MVDGALTTIAGQGDVLLNEHLTLKNVLHVPKLFANLISIQKLIEDTNCSAFFYSNVCEIQEQGKKRMIGLVRAREGLYSLEEPDGQDKQRFFSRVPCLVQSNSDQFWLQHYYRLGHPSFHTLKLMFPDLARNLEIKNFRYVVCEFAKHKEKLDSGLICTPYISSHNQLANVLTKGLPAAVFRRMTSKIGMHDIHN